MLVAFWLLLKTEHMGKPWNNESAEKWWAKKPTMVYGLKSTRY